LYIGREGVDCVVTSTVAKEQVRYEALVLTVELQVGGALSHGSARSLYDRGWGLFIEREEEVQLLRKL